MSRRVLVGAVRAGVPSWARSGRAATPSLIRTVTSNSTLISEPPPNPDSFKVLFPPTSSKPLNDLLEAALLRIILPSHLPNAERKEIFRARYLARRKNNPIILELEGYEHHLPQITKETYVPSNDELVAALENHATEPEDWKILPNLLAGLESAGRPLRTGRLLRVINAAGRAGHIYAVVESARRARRTGLYVARRDVTLFVLHWLQRRAMAGGWDPRRTSQTLGWAEAVLDLARDPDHVPPLSRRPRGAPLHKDPLVLASVLHLAAGLAAADPGAEAAGGKLARYAQLVAENWRDDRAIRSVELAGPPDAVAESEIFHSRSQYLTLASPALRGIELAAGMVEDKAVAEKLAAIAATLRAEVEKTLTESEGHVTSGVEVYRLVFEGGPEPQVAEKQAVADGA